MNIVEKNMQQIIKSLSEKNQMSEYITMPLEDVLEHLFVNFIEVVDEHLDILCIIFKEEEVRKYVTHEEFMKQIGDKDVWFCTLLKEKAARGEIKDMDFELAAMDIHAIMVSHILAKVFDMGLVRLEDETLRKKIIMYEADMWKND